MLNDLRDLLSGIYDVPVPHDLGDFLLTDRRDLPEALQDTDTDEQVLVASDGDTVHLGVYLDPEVLERLDSANPFDALHHGNIGDYWTALEGVSHFVYLAWNAAHDRPVTLLELELQAEVDKYVASLWLLREQNPARFPVELHPALFEQARVDPELAGARGDLYHCANRYAARFCRRLARKLHARRAATHDETVAELRRFYRLNREPKMRHIERAAA